MVKPHFSAYSINQSMLLNSVIGGWYTVKLMLFDWEVYGVKVIGKLLLLLLSPIYIAVMMVLSVYAIGGYIVNFIPIVNFVYSLVFILIWNIVAVPLAMLINIHSLSEYAEKLTEFDQSFFIWEVISGIPTDSEDDKTRRYL